MGWIRRRPASVWPPAPQPGQPLYEFRAPTPEAVVAVSTGLAREWAEEVHAASADLRLRGFASSNPALRDLAHTNLDDGQRHQLRALVQAALDGPPAELPRGWHDRSYRYAGVMLRDPFTLEESPRPVVPPLYHPTGDRDWQLDPTPAAGRVWRGVLEVGTPDGIRVVADTGREIERWCLLALSRAGWTEQLLAKAGGTSGARWIRRLLSATAAQPAPGAVRRP